MQNGHYFAENIFNFILVNENSFILMFVPEGPIENKS